MNRRIAIRNMALILGSAAVLPSCLGDKSKSKPLVELKHLQLNGDEQQLVANLAETILPKTDTPGAKDLNLHLFAFKMIDDCMNKQQQDDFKAGLKAFADAADAKYKKSFNDCTVAERTAFVKEAEKGIKDKAKDDAKMLAFYDTVKQQTVFGYTTSQYFMTKQVVYELVPGRYNAMYPAAKKESV